jgi:predicted acetyltransferase
MKHLKYLRRGIQLFENFNQNLISAFNDIKNLKTIDTKTAFVDGVKETDENTVLIGPVKIRIYIEDDYLLLAHISCSDKGNKYATNVMKELCDIADKHKVNIVLTAASLGKNGLNDNQLIIWYSKFGFKELKNSEMIRVNKN